MKRVWNEYIVTKKLCSKHDRERKQLHKMKKKNNQKVEEEEDCTVLDDKMTNYDDY